jgi:hypothetical protein
MGATGMLAASKASEGLTKFAGAYYQSKMQKIKSEEARIQSGMAKLQGDAAMTHANFQKQQFEFNARLSEYQAEDAVRKGETQTQEHGTRTKQLIGKQRASLAAQGIDIESGSALDVQEDTAVQSAVDIMTIRNNAWREAWGFKVQADDYKSKGRLAEYAGRFSKLQSEMDASAANFTSWLYQKQAQQTLLIGGLQALNSGGDATYTAIKK